MYRAKLVLLFGTSCLAAFGSTIVVPNAYTSVVGNSTDSSNEGSIGGLRAQTLLGSDQFASVGGPIWIDQLSLRAAPGTGPVDFSMALPEPLSVH